MFFCWHPLDAALVARPEELEEGAEKERGQERRGWEGDGNPIYHLARRNGWWLGRLRRCLPMMHSGRAFRPQKCPKFLLFLCLAHLIGRALSVERFKGVEAVVFPHELIS